MAGSWKHITTRRLRLRGPERLYGLIDNAGDAYEMAEECFGMVWWLAHELAKAELQHPEPDRAQVTMRIRQAERHYKEGLSLGGISRDQVRRTT